MIDLPDKLFSSGEVADILGVSLRSVYRYLDEGKIIADVKTITGRHRFSKKNIEDFLYPEQSLTAATSVSKPVSAAMKPRAQAKKPAAKLLVKPFVKPAEEFKEQSTPITASKTPVDWLTKFREAQAMRTQTAQSAAVRPQAPVQPQVPAQPQAQVPFQPQQSMPAPQASMGTSAVPVQAPVSPAAPVDWLSKFRTAREEIESSKQASMSNLAPSAAQMPSQPQYPVQPQPQSAPMPAQQPASQYPASFANPMAAPAPMPASAPVDYSGPAPMQAASAPTPVPTPTPMPEPAPIAVPDPVTSSTSVAAVPTAPQLGFFYYTSNTKGLKELAHLVHRYASASYLPYAFTLYAGMSLFKSIKPFSLIHTYIKPENKAMFEQFLQLTPASKDSAQVCLISTDDSVIFDTSKEMHGLKVVSLVRLRKDLMEAGEEELAGELDTLQQ